MKKILSIVAIVALFATSCVKSELDNVQVVPGGEEVVTLTLQTPNLGSRAIAEGDKATDLHYAIYDENWNALVVEQTTINITKTIEVRLVKNKEYNFVFWAQSPSATCYAVDLGAVGDLTVDPSIVVDYANANANDDHRDAFFGQKNLTVNGTINETVYLKRPFAQINFGTNDTTVAATGGFDIRANDATTTFTARAYNTLYLKDGSVKNEQDVTFVAAALPKVQSFTTSLGNYDWLAMNYLLWPDAADLSLSTCKMTVTAQGQNITVEYPGAPARRNYRTNLVGSLLTEEGNVKVEILPGTDGDNNVEIVSVANPTDLQSKIDALADNAEKSYQVSETLSGDNALTIKNNLTDGELSFDFAAIEAGATLVINDESDQYTGIVTIVVPNSMSSSEALSALTIDLPNATVEIVGAFGTVTATTANNTLVIPEGTTLDKLVAVKGNVSIYGVVVAIEKDASYDGVITKYVKAATELNLASGVDKFVLVNDIAVDADTTIEIASGKTISLDLNGKTLSSTNTRTNTHNDFILVKGTLNVENGTITYEHTGTNMGWNGCTNLLDITAGGVANLNGVVVNNIGGTDMNFAAHLNNWGTVTLNADNCEFLSTYCGVRLFNSGYDMNNVTISNSKMTGATRAFWVHNFTNEGKDASTLNVSIFNRGNIFEITGQAVSPIRYGFTNASYYIIAEDGSIYFQTPDAVTISSYNGTEADVVLPNEVNGIPVTVLGGYLFNGKTLNSVVLPNNVEVIGSRAFRKTTITSGEVILPNTVTTLEEGAFQGATHTTITIPENVTYIGKQSIGYSSTLETIIIKAKNPTICNYVARACANLKSVYIYSDDVTFDTGSMYFTNKENADASAITFYVNGQALADKLYAALSTSHSYGLKIVSIDGATTYYNTLK